MKCIRCEGADFVPELHEEREEDLVVQVRLLACLTCGATFLEGGAIVEEPGGPEGPPG
jgi:hypothetical protein